MDMFIPVDILQLFVSTNMPSNLRPDHQWCMVCGAIQRVQMKVDDGSSATHEQTFVTFFAKLSSDRHRQTDRQTRPKSYTTPLR